MSRFSRLSAEAEEVNKFLNDLQREHESLKVQFQALADHLKLVVTVPYVDKYGTVHGQAVVRERCKECGR